MILRRVLVPAVASAMFVCSLAAPGTADTMDTPAVVDATAEKADDVRLVTTGVTAGVFVDGLRISGTCSATAVGVVTAVVITECRLVRADGKSTDNHPGSGFANSAVSTFSETINTLDFQLCYQAYAIPTLDPTNPVYSGRRCGTPVLDLPAGVDVAMA
jgi:hypothetical protein